METVTTRSAYSAYPGYIRANEKSDWSETLITWVIVLGLIAFFGGLTVAGFGQLGATHGPTGFFAKTYKLDPNLTASQLRRLGAECNSQNKSECSMAVYSRLLQMDPSDTSALINLAIAQTNAGFHHDSLMQYEQYFKKGYETYDAAAYYATSLRAVGQRDHALKWYGRALELNPRLLDVTERMLDIMIEKEDYRSASALVASFVHNNPSGEQYLRSRKKLIHEKMMN